MSKHSKIDNTTLFEFEFTDREGEQQKLENFLNNNYSNILWIYGKSGTGKTFFVRQCTQQCNVIYVKNTKNEEAGNCILNIIDGLQNLNDNSFWNFIHNHFHGIKAIVKDIPALKQLTNSNFLQYALSKNFYLIDKNNQPNNLVNILQLYINHFFDKTTLIFIIDNFNECDENSVEFLLNFVKINVNNMERKFIFITTDNDNDLNEKKLEKQISIKKLSISEIPDADLFINMLPTTFDKSNLRTNDIKRIFDVCRGIPEKLQDLLHNLNKIDGIEYYNDKMAFNLSIVEKYILSDGTSELKIDDFTPSEKCILLSIICMGIPLDMSFLFLLSQKIFINLFGLPFDKNKFEDNIQKMIPKPLKMDFSTKKPKIYTDHDLTFDAILLYFQEENMYQLSCNIIYEYLEKDMPDEFKNNFSEYGQKEILANLSYNGQNSNWITLNLECGKIFYKNANYIQAAKYFNLLLEVSDIISESDMLCFAIANYEVGSYDIAYRIIQKISDTNVINNYNYLIYAGKIFNMNNNYNLAEDSFRKAVKLSKENSDDQMYAKYMLNIILTQIPNRWNEAKKIYMI